MHIMKTVQNQGGLLEALSEANCDSAQASWWNRRRGALDTQGFQGSAVALSLSSHRYSLQSSEGHRAWRSQGSVSLATSYTIPHHVGWRQPGGAQWNPFPHTGPLLPDLLFNRLSMACISLDLACASNCCLFLRVLSTEAYNKHYTPTAIVEQEAELCLTRWRKKQSHGVEGSFLAGVAQPLSHWMAGSSPIPSGSPSELTNRGTSDQQVTIPPLLLARYTGLCTRYRATGALEFHSRASRTHTKGQVHPSVWEWELRVASSPYSPPATRRGGVGAGTGGAW